MQRTKGNFYEVTGKNRHERRSKELLGEFNSMNERLSKFSTKTANVAQFLEHIRLYCVNRDRVWAVTSGDKFRRMKLDCHIKTQKYFNDLGNRLQHGFDDESWPLVFFGDANISSTLKFNRPAPTCSMQAAFLSACEVVYIDEFRTTIIKANCGQLSEKVSRCSSSGFREVLRGLVFCGCQDCCNDDCQLSHRDINATSCLAIKTVFRPRKFERGDGQNLTKKRGEKVIRRSRDSDPPENDVRRDYIEKRNERKDAVFIMRSSLPVAR